MKHAGARFLMAMSLGSLLLTFWQQAAFAASAKVDCGPVTNKSNELPRTAAIGTNPAGTFAHAMASTLAAVGSKATSISVTIQPFNGPNAWMSLLQNGELEFGVINILDSYMAMTGTGDYKKPNPTLRVVSGGVFPFMAGMFVRDKSDIKEPKDLKGKRIAWDYGGHAVNQAWQNAMLEIAGIKPNEIVQARVSSLVDSSRGVAEGRIDATTTGLGIALNDEANAREPIRFLNVGNSDGARKILAKLGAAPVRALPVTGVKGVTYVIGYPLQLASSTKVGERTVFTLAKAWWENIGEIQPKHALLKNWTKETQAITNFTVPYHPGAINFYKEVGIWTSAHEARLKEICQ